MLKYIVSITTSLFLLVGCQMNDSNQQDTSQENNLVEDEMKVKNDPNQKYRQSLEKGVGEGGYKEQFFSSAEQREIIQHVSQMKNVVSVYVNHGSERVNIVVSVKEGPYEEIKKEIKGYVKERFPQRKIDVQVIQSTG